MQPQYQAILQRFNGDTHTKEALIEYIHSVIDDEALERVYKKLDVSTVADARKLIDLAFEKLEDEFAIKQPKPEPTINHAK